MMQKSSPLMALVIPGVISLVLAGLLSACGGAPVVPDDNFYRLQAAEPSVGKKLFPGTMEVDRFVADGLTAGRPIIYSEAGKSYQLKKFHYHFWIQSPTVMLRDELVTYLRRAKISDMVVTPELRISADYVLSGKIKRLEKIIGKQPKTALEIELGLKKVAGGKLIFLKTYRMEMDSDGKGVGDAVASLNQSLSAIYAQFITDLSKR